MWLAILLLHALACNGTPSAIDEIRELQLQGNFGATIEPLRARLKERPDDSELRFLYGLALSRTGQVSLAIWSLREAQQDPDWFEPASLELARAALVARDFPTAIEAASGVLEVAPDHVEALQLRGRARLEDQIDAEGALEDFARILELEPDDLPTRLNYMRSLLALERVEEAEAWLAEADQLAESGGLLEGEAASICVIHASFAHERGEIEQAEELFEKCLAANEASADGFSSTVLDAAMAFFDGAGRSERATEILGGVQQRFPESTLLRGRLARRLRAEGRAAEAEALLLEATRSEFPELRAHAWSALTDHYIALDDLASAVEALESAIAYEGELPPQRRLAYADLLAGAGRNQRALEVAAELEDTTLRDLIRARVALNQGRPCEALELFEGAFRFWPNNAVARYYAARAAEQCDAFDKAIEHYQQALRSDPAASDAGLRLARMLVAEGRMEDALFGIQQFLNGHRGHPETMLLRTRAALALQDAPLLQNTLNAMPASRLRAQAMAILARHAASQQGPGVAIAGLRADPNLDMTLPHNAPALSLLVELLVAEGRSDEARALVDAALARHPEAAAFHCVRAKLLEASGAPAGEVQAVLERALELEPEHFDPLLAAARAARKRGAAERAVSLFDRAAAAEPSQTGPAREAALALVEAGDPAAAEERLRALLLEFPHDAAAAMALAELRVAQGRREEAIRWARRALRFGGGPPAEQLLERLGSA